MKKMFFLFAILVIIFTSVLKAQTIPSDTTCLKRLLQKVTKITVGGEIVATARISFPINLKNQEETTAIPGNKMNLVHCNIIPSITMNTSYGTYHTISVGLFDVSLQVKNGYYLKNNYDLFIVYSNTFLINRGNYLGVGAQWFTRFESGREGIKVYLLTELGTDFRGNILPSLGLRIDSQNLIWERK